MSIRNLEALLHPRSVAVIGASSRSGTIGDKVFRNIVDGGFSGPVWAVNPKPVAAERWVRSIADLPANVDMAVIVTPAATIPALVTELAAKGVKVAVVISAGFDDPVLRHALLDAARPTTMRIIGPNGLGVLMPHARLNASFGEKAADAGGLALLAQSGALVTSMIDWAGERGVGFSGIVSVGDKLDVDFADLIDAFAADPRTHAIALYVEGLTNPAKFMSAARAAARLKPVIALKAGRTEAAGRAALSHTGAITGAYDVHRAAFQRAGIVTVDTLTELFDAAQVLANRNPFRGDRLAIVTNGGGPGILAADALADTGGKLATLEPTTIKSLDPHLPKGWSHSDPIDVVGDAHADRFAWAIAGAARDPNVDAVLVMHCPTAVATGVEIARGVIETYKAPDYPRHKPLIACWLGTHNATAAAPLFRAAGVPLFDNVDDAVRGFSYLIEAREARDALMRAPEGISVPEADRSRARMVIAGARHDGRTTLSAIEAKSILAAYGVPVAPTRFASDPGAVADACARLPAPYVLKIVSPQLSHKSDVGGVVLNLPDAEAATAAAQAMHKRLHEEHPEAQLVGYEIETMIDATGRHELLAGIADDPTFGPVIAFGAGGKAVEILHDRALGLPPLDDTLALRMIDETRVAKLLHGYRDVPPANIPAIVRTLNALAQIAIDLPDVAELDINPLIAGPDGVIAIDGRVRITPEPGTPRLVIRPVPREWIADVTTRADVKLHIRPVVPTDEPLLEELFRDVSPDDLRFRFLSAIHHVDHERIAAMTQIDYRRAMNFLAFAEDGALVATAMLVSDSDRTRAELAVSVRSGWKGKGISWTLMQHVLRYADAEGIGAVESLESVENHAAIALERELGFTTRPCPDSPSEVIVRKELRPA